MSEEEACKFESTGKIKIMLSMIRILDTDLYDYRNHNWFFLDTESNESCQTDYSEKRAIPISIPTLHVKNKNGERYVVRFTVKYFNKRIFLQSQEIINRIYKSYINVFHRHMILWLLEL